MKKLNYILVLMLLFVILVTGTESCSDIGGNKSDKLLANTYCGTCHKLPNPESLTKDVWMNHIMPKMSEYYNWDEVSRFRYANKSPFQEGGTIPMTDSIWVKLEQYFISGGLDEPKIRADKDLPIQNDFEVTQINNICSGRGITAVTINEDNNNIIAACDIELLTISPEGQLLKSYNSGGATSGIFPIDTSLVYILDAGILDPHSEALGALKVWNHSTDKLKTIQTGLQRPVHISGNETNIFISEYGDKTGRLGQVQLQPKKYLSASNLPGPYKSFICDYDKDGNDEIIVMFAQAMEGIYVREVDAINKRFVPLLSFVPEWGISDIDTTDVNHDGWTDLVVVNGDNADFSIMPKAYHGVRVYLNNQKGGYEESYSYPMYGASQVRTLDANGDGFDDLLVGAFFAIEEKDRLLLLLHNGNRDDVSYTPHRISEANRGRWMVINKGDIDGDGDLDAIIGSFVISQKRSSINENEEDKTNLLLLLNRSK